MAIILTGCLGRVGQLQSRSENGSREFGKGTGLGFLWWWVGEARVRVPTQAGVCMFWTSLQQQSIQTFLSWMCRCGVQVGEGGSRLKSCQQPQIKNWSQTLLQKGMQTLVSLVDIKKYNDRTSETRRRNINQRRYKSYWIKIADTCT